MTEIATTQLIGIAVPTLRELRGTALACLSASATGEADAVDALREAGFAGGPAVFEAFEQWLAENGRGSDDSTRAADLTLAEFGKRAADYFRAAGWGIVEFEADKESGVAMLTMDGCWEADRSSQVAEPSCHVTTGMLAAFFGKLAGFPVAVMETECSSAGASACRFLLGNSEVMTYRWEQLR
jgi:V4R domain